MLPYTAPEFRKSAFNCPNCNAYAEQTWYPLTRYETYSNDFVEDAFTSTCSHCQKYTIWINEFMIYPTVNGVTNPHPEMPEEIKRDYEEARSIVARSPRGAAALLRLAIQKLTEIMLVQEKGKDLNDNIKILVEKGLPEKIQQASDYLRVIGNNAVHPGQIDIRDNREIANALFELLNIIVDVMISQPNKIKGLYSKLPEKDKSNIQKRDNKPT